MKRGSILQSGKELVELNNAMTSNNLSESVCDAIRTCVNLSKRGHATVASLRIAACRTHDPDDVEEALRYWANHMIRSKS